MSIFKKDCPECATPNNVDAVRCDCGYCFDPEALAGADAAEYAQEQTRLYRDYLAARIVQAEAELTVARERAHAEPGNTYKAAEALVAEQALNALQAEMKQLGMRPPKTTRISTAAPSRTPIAPKATPAKTSAPNAAAPPSKPPVASPSNPPPRATAVAASPSAARKSPPSFKNHVVHARREPAPAISKVEPPPTKRKPTETADAAAIATGQTATPAARAVSMKREPATPVQVATPSPVFRNMQARKAEAIAKAKLAVEATPISPVSAPMPAQRVEPPAALSPITASAKNAKNPTQECPSCTATVPADLEKCRCGYTFSQSTKEVPALTLDAAALAILTEGIAPKNTSRRR